MTTTLPNGTKVPDVASTNWAGDLEVNWQLLDAAIGAIGSNVQTNRPNTWTAEQTFSEPIIGNLTGTASRAGADEDGTSIKTGYVNVAGNQTVSGHKTWTGVNNVTNSDFNFSQNFILGDGSFHLSRLQFYDSAATRWGVLAYRHNADNSTETQIGLYSLKSDNTTTSQFITFQLANDGNAAFRPFFTDQKISLGTSTNKWKTLNGINPGALSLPNIEASINIAGDITDFTGATQVSLSSSYLGWIYIQIPNVQGDYIEVQVGNTASIRYFVYAGYRDSLDFMEVLVPKPQVVTKVRVKATGGAVSKALFYPCLGNV